MTEDEKKAVVAEASRKARALADELAAPMGRLTATSPGEVPALSRVQSELVQLSRVLSRLG
jgi:hypothetical protein